MITSEYLGESVDIEVQFAIERDGIAVHEARILEPEWSRVAFDDFPAELQEQIITACTDVAVGVTPDDDHDYDEPL